MFLLSLVFCCFCQDFVGHGKSQIKEEIYLIKANPNFLSYQTTSHGHSSQEDGAFVYEDADGNLIIRHTPQPSDTLKFNLGSKEELSIECYFRAMKPSCDTR